MSILSNDLKAYVFPGQGSQFIGMGKDLFDKYPDMIAQADAILGYKIKDLCLNDDSNNLNLTCYTQPALYVVECLSYLEKIKVEGKPDYVAGHSLGEYAALFASGVFDFASGLRLVMRRGELMYLAHGGGMAAVIGLTAEEIKDVLRKNNLCEIDVANFNTVKQTVISGKKDDINNAKEIFEAANARYVILNVSGAFHSRYMKDAQEEFAKYLDEFEFSEPQIPVISNVSARPYKSNDIKKNMIDQITSSVQWVDTIRYLMGKNVLQIEQVAPGNVVKKMVDSILDEATPLIVENEEKVEESISENTSDKCKMITAQLLGNAEFKRDYNIKYAYIAGSMYHGISSKEMVIKMAKAGMLGFLGTGGMKKEEIIDNIVSIKRQLNNNEFFGVNLLSNIVKPYKEEETVDIFLQYGINLIEASAYMSISPAISRYRIKGLYRNSNGIVCGKNRIIAKISRPEVAEAFLSPVPDKIIQLLLSRGMITQSEAEMAKEISVADELCVEADSGGHTDGGVLMVLLPEIIYQRNMLVKKYGYKKSIRVGAAGGIGTPEAAAAAFIMGADFITTGSINECTVEAGISDIVKDMLQGINVQDTEYAPAGDMFEMGAKVQVLKKGVFFPARANKLFELYKQNNSIDEIDINTRKQIEERFFHKTFDEVFEECKEHYSRDVIKNVEMNPKQKMAMIFRWYFAYSTRLALNGVSARKVDFQIQCGPALGSFNQWVLGTEIEDWRDRHVDLIGKKIMEETAVILNKRYDMLLGK